MCCSPWGCKESDMTEQLNCSESSMYLFLFFNLFLIGGKLFYSVALISAIQQCEPVIIICIYLLPCELPSPKILYI